MTREAVRQIAALVAADCIGLMSAFRVAAARMIIVPTRIRGSAGLPTHSFIVACPQEIARAVASAAPMI